MTNKIVQFLLNHPIIFGAVFFYLLGLAGRSDFETLTALAQ